MDDIMTDIRGNSDGASIAANIETQTLLSRPLCDWHGLLARECGVYSCGEHYLAKRIDEVQCRRVSSGVARRIIIDNIYILLSYKYFPIITDKVNKRIKEIAKDFSENLRARLLTVTIAKNPQIGGLKPANMATCLTVAELPDGCIAFRNGVYDFRRGAWLFKYDVTDVPQISARIYRYDLKYIIRWYFDFDFKPMPEIWKAITNAENEPLHRALIRYDRDIKQNNCFRLAFNGGMIGNAKFDPVRFRHLCEIMGYLCTQSPTVYRAVGISASAQSGMRTLFSECFAKWIKPGPVSVQLFGIVPRDAWFARHNVAIGTDKVRMPPKEYIASELRKARCAGTRSVVGVPPVVAESAEKAGLPVLRVYFDRAKIKERCYKFESGPELYDSLRSDIRNPSMFAYLAAYGLKSATRDYAMPFRLNFNEV